MKASKKTVTRRLTFSAIAIALAVVCSFLKLASLPFGGSITLFSMFFICLIGYFYGPAYGFLAGVAYGLLQFAIEPFLFHPVQMILDYPLAFGMLGLAGLFKDKKYGLQIGIAFGVFGRYICHVISGYIFFKEYAGDSDPIIYTLGYNLTYILPELIATLIVVSIPPVYKAIQKVRTTARQ